MITRLLGTGGRVHFETQTPDGIEHGGAFFAAWVDGGIVFVAVVPKPEMMLVQNWSSGQ